METLKTTYKSLDYQHLVPGEVWIACWRSVTCDQTLDIASLAYGLAPDNWIERFHALHRAAVRLDSLAASEFPAFVQIYEQLLRDTWAIRERIVAAYRDAAVFETLRGLSRFETLHLRVENIHVNKGYPAIAGSGPPPWKLRSLHLHDVHQLLTMDAFSTSSDRLVCLSLGGIGSVEDMEPVANPFHRCAPSRPPASAHPSPCVSWSATWSWIDISHSTVPVQILALPRAALTIDFIRRLVALFPDVRALSLVLTNPVRAYGLSLSLPHFPFDGLPAEEVSDDETAELTVPETDANLDSTPVPFSTEYIETALQLIYDGLLHLPPNIESFRLGAE
ncbi:hypothetical protein C8R45DRAFT_1112548 [Mycena sanguinolenta]|nr:hypothetical protein C8R45DRAFT_1112548 [Mycena sanguinolenta]